MDNRPIHATLDRRAFLRRVGLGSAILAFPASGKTGTVPSERVPERDGTVPGFAKPPAAKRPNVLVLLCDDLGYGDLACYGHPHIKTPNLDQLAAEGIRLTDCYAAAPVCSPSRVGMLTGRTPYRCGVVDWIPENHAMHLGRSEVTIATLLKRAGYATCHVGKWHCNGKFNDPEQPQPGDHGFDYWCSTQNNAHPSHHNPDNFVRNGQPVGKLEGYSSELIADEAITWLERHWNRAQPFCLFVWFHAPHEPIATGERFMRMYEGHKEAVYYGNVSQMDHAAGRLTQALDRMHLREDTFVLFTSDNGPETLERYRGSSRSFGSPGPLRGMKLHLYEGGIRVPGILRWPGRAAPGTESDTPVCGTDVLPTLCALAGVDVPAGRPVDGTSILPLLSGMPVRRETPLYWRYDKALSKPYTAAMRQGDWKILADKDMTTFQLFNLRDDLREQHDLAAQAPERLDAMKKALAALHAEIDAELKTHIFE